MKVARLVSKQAESVRLATARLNIWEGSVRSSKTISSLIKWLQFVRQGPDGNLLMTGKTERTLKRNIIDPLVEMLGDRRCHHVVGSGELWLLGRRVYLAGANDERSQEKIRGLTLAGAYVDEISTVPESYWSMLLTRLSVPAAQLFGTSNPDSPAHWLKRDYLDRARLWLNHGGETLISSDSTMLDLHRFSFRLADNPHLSPEYVAALSSEFVGLWRKRFIEGLWVAAEGAIYDMWDPDRHVIDVLPPMSRWLAVGIDYGTTAPFAAELLGLGVNRKLYLVDEWRWDSRQQHRQLTDVEYSQRLRDWLQQVRLPASQLHGVRPEYVIVDPSAASFRTQLYQDGMNPVLGDNSVLDGIRLMSALLGGGSLQISRTCRGFIDEAPSYSWDDRAARLGEDKPVKVADHSLDAARYATVTSRQLWHTAIPLTA